MDVELKTLIEKIKSEGVKSAEEQSAQIRKEAEQRAEEIVAGAHRKAAKIVSLAKEEAGRFEQSAREALRQAGRDLILTVKNRLIELFKTVIHQEAGAAISQQVLQESIVSLVKGWNEKRVTELQVLLPAGQLKKVEQALLSKLAGELKKGLEIKPLAELKAGFRVAVKDGSAYYNFSDQGIAEILAEYLNPRLAEIINQAIQEGK